MLLNKRLRVIVPTLQVLLLVSVFVWLHIVEKHYINQPQLINRYVVAPIDIVGKLNFPLLVLWFPVVYPINYLLYNSNLNLPSEVPLVVILGVFALAALASVALFWYFVVAEVEMRSHGSSLIRSLRRMLEILKAVVLAVAGVGAVAYACWDGHRLLILGQNNRSLYGSSMADAMIGGLILVIWAIVLIKMSVRDVMVALLKNEKALAES